MNRLASCYHHRHRHRLKFVVMPDYIDWRLLIRIVLYQIRFFNHVMLYCIVLYQIQWNTDSLSLRHESYHIRPKPEVFVHECLVYSRSPLSRTCYETFLFCPSLDVLPGLFLQVLVYNVQVHSSRRWILRMQFLQVTDLWGERSRSSRLQNEIENWSSRQITQLEARYKHRSTEAIVKWWSEHHTERSLSLVRWAWLCSGCYFIRDPMCL